MTACTRSGLPLDDHEGHTLPVQLFGDEAADAAVAAHDEVIPQGFEHAFSAGAHRGCAGVLRRRYR
jgi:hypothetical protein